MKIFEEIGRKADRTTVLCNIAIAYDKQGNYSKTIDYFSEALKVNEEDGNEYDKAQLLNFLAKAQIEHKDYSKCIDNATQSLAISKKGGYKSLESFSDYLIGYAYLSIVKEARRELLLKYFGGNTNKALQIAENHLQQAVILSKEQDNLNDLADYYLGLSNAQELLGKPELALGSYKNSVILKDSVYSIEKNDKINQTIMQYEFDKKEAATKAEQEKKDFRQRLILYAVLLGLLAALVFSYLIYKQRNLIAQQNELNEHTISILSHDIKEPLLGVKLMLKKLDKDDPFVAQASQIFERQLNSVNSILTNLLKMKKVALSKDKQKQIANVNAVVQNVMRDLSISIENKALTIENSITDNQTLPISPEKLQIIVQNLLSNAVKYSYEGQNIRIYPVKNGFCIQDFGVGLSPELRRNLMKEVAISKRGTHQERGNGLGLFLIGTMLQGEHIKVMFDSPDIGGTIVSILS